MAKGEEMTKQEALEDVIEQLEFTIDDVKASLGELESAIKGAIEASKAFEDIYDDLVKILKTEGDEVKGLATVDGAETKVLVQAVRMVDIGG